MVSLSQDYKHEVLLLERIGKLGSISGQCLQIFEEVIISKKIIVKF